MKIRTMMMLLSLACGTQLEPEEVGPSERSLEEAGIEGAEEIANITQTPRVSEFVFQPVSIGAHASFGKIAKGAVKRSEAITCDKETLECETSVGFYQDGRRLTDQEAFDMGLPVEFEDLPETQMIQGELQDYWATSQIAAAPTAGGVSARRPGAPVAAPPAPLLGSCIAGPDLCAIGFDPWCNGGAGKISPGGIAESAYGCRGSEIAHGGFRRIRPDNARHRVSFWGGQTNSCNDTSFTNSPELNYVINFVNDRDRTLPPPWEIIRAGCNTAGLPPGWVEDPGQCSQPGGTCIIPGTAVTDGTLTDVVLSYRSLQTNAAGLHEYCTEAGNTGPGKNRANAVTMGCAEEILEATASGPTVRSWNNGFTSTTYWTARGYMISVDQIAINWWATRPANKLDRGGLDLANRLWFISVHVVAHELGHSLGLKHAYIGSDGSPRWNPHSRAENAMTPNPNMIPFSVMHRSVPAAPWTLASWSSGLATDLQSWVAESAGAGNAEAWRMSNAFRSTNDGTITFPQNSYWPPQPNTNNEL